MPRSGEQSGVVTRASIEERTVSRRRNRSRSGESVLDSGKTEEALQMG